MFIIQCPILWYVKVCALLSARSSCKYISMQTLAMSSKQLINPSGSSHVIPFPALVLLSYINWVMMMIYRWAWCVIAQLLHVLLKHNIRPGAFFFNFLFHRRTRPQTTHPSPHEPLALSWTSSWDLIMMRGRFAAFWTFPDAHWLVAPQWTLDGKLKTLFPVQPRWIFAFLLFNSEQSLQLFRYFF